MIMTIDQALNLVLSAGVQMQNHHATLTPDEWRDIANDLQRAAAFATTQAGDDYDERCSACGFTPCACGQEKY